MRRTLLLLPLLLLPSCDSDFHFGGPQLQGSGKTVTETRSVSGFERIDMAGSMEVAVEVGPETKVSVEGDDNIVLLVETTVKDGTLRIGTKGSFRTKEPLRVTVAMPSCSGIELSGSGRVEAKGFIGGSSYLTLTGSGELIASGKTGDLQATVSGSGVVDASGLVAANVGASVTGSGELRVNTTGVLKVNLAGSGVISYSGEPKSVEKNVTGSGEVRRM